MRKWENHFCAVLQQDRPISPANISPEIMENIPISRAEVETAIKMAKANKAAGPDGIYYEHIKESKDITVDLLSQLFNKCLETGRVPKQWKEAVIKMLYKGKGDPNDPNMYRGVALENTMFKLFTKIINKKLMGIINPKLCENQMGFRPHSSTINAIATLMYDVEEALRHPGGKYHVIFIDYSKAFDLLDRRTTTEKLRQLVGGSNSLTRIVEEILSTNSITIKDAVTESRKITQTNGVLQGDPLSPLLFNIATADLPQVIGDQRAQIIMYADDMALGAQNIGVLQQAFNSITEWANRNKFKINRSKTQLMTFQKGGRRTRNQQVTTDGEAIPTTRIYKYLGLTLQTTGRTYTEHITDRTTAAIRAMYAIPNLRNLSITTAMRIFQAKINPMITYAFEIIWEKLSKNNLRNIEQVKARYLKLILGLPKNAPSRLAYELSGEMFFLEEIRLHHPYTVNSQHVIEERRKKKEMIWEDFYATDAMLYRDWTQPNRELRHLTTRLATHGFHHKICKTTKYHEPSEDCVCSLCELSCDRYHIQVCKNRTKSIKEYSMM